MTTETMIAQRDRGTAFWIDRLPYRYCCFVQIIMACCGRGNGAVVAVPQRLTK